MQSNEDCGYIDVRERTTSYTTVLAEDTLAPHRKTRSFRGPTTQILCISWQMDPNYIIDYRIPKLIEAGNMVVCAGGNPRFTCNRYYS